MKFKGKIVGIINNKKKDYDTLSINPLNLNKVWHLIIFVVLILWGLFYISELFEKELIKIIFSGIAFAFGLGCYLYIHHYRYKLQGIKKPYLHEHYEIFVEKPHDFKVNDIVEINIEVKKIE